MKPFASLLLAGAVLLGGCFNIAERFSDDDAPYGLSRHPYQGTEWVWNECVCAPWRQKTGFENIWTAYATVTWPLWVVDEACEIVLDTVFLPIDGTYYLAKEKRR